MKTSNIAVAAAAVVVTTLATFRVKADTTTLVAPIGWLTTGSNLVKSGTNTPLKWAITYPSTVVDYVGVTYPALLIPKQKLDYEIRVLGAGVTISNSDGSNLSYVPTEAVLSSNGGSYNRIFYGTNNDVNPGKIVANGTLNANQTLRFGGRYYYSGSWSTLYTSSSGTKNVRTLVNGDYPPTTYTLATAPTLENFIKPYLSASGRVVIGPMDVIVFMELTHTDAQSTQQGYDCQDMVLLVTFKVK